MTPSETRDRKTDGSRGGVKHTGRGGRFVVVKCPDCSSGDQIVFDRTSTKVSCRMCGATLATPGGGRAALRGEIVEVLG